MNYLEHIKEGLRNLYDAKLRSLLALLGVLVGTASVVAMVLGGQLATNEALKQFKSLGTDLLAISINTSSEDSTVATGKADELTLQQVFEMSKADQAIQEVAPYTQLFLPTFYEGTVINGMLLGVTDSFANIVHVKLKKGRFISLLDKYSFFCVIGKDIESVIKSVTLKDPIGQQIQIGKHMFVIVGIAESWPENNFVYASIDSSILIPLEASYILSKYATINNVIAKLAPDADINRVQQHMTAYINQHVADKQVTYRSAKELIAKMRKQNDILTVFLGLIGSISLLVGGIGVMNIMLVSVIERRREIGIRLAVGARRRDIALLFLMESVVLALVGGTAGVIIGIVIAYVIALVQHWEFTFFILPPLVGFTVSVAVGIFFGCYPAYQAAKLSPIDALRSE